MPHKIRQWLNEDCIWQCEINLLASDTEIWENARKKNLIIITKDSDFSNRILIKNPPPKVIHFKVGNMKYNDFTIFINENWEKICSAIKTHKLVLVNKEKIVKI